MVRHKEIDHAQNAKNVSHLEEKHTNFLLLHLRVKHSPGRELAST